MADTFCKCGCGGPVYAASKSGFLRGHHMRGTPDATTPPQQPEDQTPDGATAEDEAESIECSMTEAQLERIWQGLPLREKAIAMLTALGLPR